MTRLAVVRNLGFFMQLATHTVSDEFANDPVVPTLDGAHYRSTDVPHVIPGAGRHWRSVERR